jgi:hypothetical protein
MYPPYQLSNAWTNLYETCCYQGTWTHLNGVLHKSLPSVCVLVCVSHIVARQRLGKNATVATNTHAKIDVLLDVSFSMRSVSCLRKVCGYFFPEILVSKERSRIKETLDILGYRVAWERSEPVTSRICCRRPTPIPRHSVSDRSIKWTRSYPTLLTRNLTCRYELSSVHEHKLALNVKIASWYTYNRTKSSKPVVKFRIIKHDVMFASYV